jgi:hypothetical protein
MSYDGSFGAKPLLIMLVGTALLQRVVTQKRYRLQDSLRSPRSSCRFDTSYSIFAASIQYPNRLSELSYSSQSFCEQHTSTFQNNSEITTTKSASTSACLRQQKRPQSIHITRSAENRPFIDTSNYVVQSTVKPTTEEGNQNSLVVNHNRKYGISYICTLIILAKELQ